jgi:signal transduction histidine kinase/CheY-like chemotaxis protein
MKWCFTKIVIYCFILHCALPYAFSQNLARIDSLEIKLSIEKNDSIKIELLNQLFQEVSAFDIDKAKYYNNKQFEIAKVSQDNFAWCMAQYTKGFYHFYVSEFDSVVVNMKKALSYAEKGNDRQMMITIKGRIGSVYVMLKENDSALYYINRTIDLSKKFNDNSNLALGHLEKGNFYIRDRKYEEALKNYLIVDSILNKEPVSNDHILNAAWLNISSIYINLEYYERAEVYALKLLEIGKENISKENSMMAEITLGRIYLYRKEYHIAEEKFNLVLDYYTQIKNRYRQADLLFLLGVLNGEQNKIEEAKSYYHKALAIRKEINDVIGQNTVLQNLGNIYFRENNFIQSQKYYLETLDISRKINNLQDEVNSLWHLAEINFITQNFQEASRYYKEYNPLKDSLTKRMNFDKVTELETQYQTAQKEQEIAFLNTQNELAVQKHKNQRTLYLSLMGLAALLGFVLYYSYRKRLQTAEKIKELDQLKTRFFSNISHEFRTPLTLIKSPLQGLQKSEIEPIKKQQLKLIDQNTNRLMQLVEQLLDLSKMEGNTAQFLFKNTSLHVFIENLIEPYSYQADEKNIDFQKNLTINSHGWIDQDVLEKILSNLMGNALKYTPDNHSITFNAQIEADHLKLEVKNTGVILKDRNLNKLFDRFYQEDINAPGAGIGLALTKELIIEMNGKITPRYANDELTFEVLLPITKEKLNIPNAVFVEEATKTSQLTQINQPTEKQLLLIVDDNPSVCAVIAELFKNDFQILKAYNGKDAFEIATSQIPDIIISDLMMPGIDGFALAKMLKENELTSFIPLVMLTAKTDDDTHLKALKLNADAFLNKPFNNEILFEKVNQLIESRKQLQERYSQELILIPQDFEVPDLDKEFLEKVQKVMESQLSNSEFTADDMASQLAVSRMQLYRKLKSITGLSSLEYIKNYRLQTARVLLSSSKLQVAEVAYSVGFNNAKYFSKCYKELFGMLPSQQ